MNPKIDVVILAAGFGTRLGKLGEEIPKGLIALRNGDCLLGRLMKDLKSDVRIDKIFMVTNGLFYDVYKKWLVGNKLFDEIKVFNNGIQVAEKRNGALKDLFLISEEFDLSKSDLLVVPSDTFYGFNFLSFVDQIVLNRNNFLTIVRKVHSKNEIKGRLGCAVVENGKIISFEEKPKKPKSYYAAIPFYYYPKEYLSLLPKYLREGNNPDAPGNIIPWLIKKKKLATTYVTNEKALDVGTMGDVVKLRKLR